MTGALGLVGGLVLFLLGNYRSPSLELSPFYMAVGVPLFILGIIALAGGVNALHRKTWGLALAGSICAVVFSPPTGIPAVLLTALSRKEFTYKQLSGYSGEGEWFWH
jgi:hypothetical protein